MSWPQAEFERILANLIRVGVVDKLDEANARVRVKTGGMTTDWLPWMTTRAGEDRTWWAPEPGEQVLVLSPFGDLSQGIVIPAIYQDAYSAPANAKTISRSEFKDGAFVQYNRETHEYSLDVPAGGKITIRCGSSKIELTNDGAKVIAPRIDWN